MFTDTLAKDIILLIIGALLPEIFKFIYNKAKRMIRNWEIDEWLNKTAQDSDNNYKFFEHAIPQYRDNHLILRDFGKKLIVGIPEPYSTKLATFNFVSNETTSLNSNLTIVELLQKAGIPNAADALSRAAVDAAKTFLEALEEGYTRFNGLMFGIEHIRSERKVDNNHNEHPALYIDFYTTDYFTYRVFATIYDRYKDLDIFQGLTTRALNPLNIFLSSFGLSTFIIINKGDGDEVVIARRSNEVVVDRNKWHFSMNEAFSMKDRDEFDHPSLECCLFRGLEEELGISPEYKSVIKKFGFMDFGMDFDRFEAGVSSYARIELSEQFTYNDFIRFYSIAQDGKLETSSIRTIPIRDIPKFLKENSNISSGCRAGLEALLIRYKAGYMREE